ncbi:hypothetical protein ANCCEY_00367 [Ancylostoma ceylanicum]|uniref:Peptidase S1 domain-containing protein n=1 Tax=Ancylostoma ceylanicum TaxID=53326 RepID=A0A0D6M8M5_9BILA|nr:hypothetical protein ANCCEY_00367 [Ancylostoma ceylanicum]
MNVLTWIAIASLHKINQQENENLKASCGAIHLKVPEKRCTGVLISKRHVLTAAHCVYDNSQVILPGPYCNPHGKLLPTLDMTIYLGTKCPKPGDCPNGEERTPYKPRYIIPHPKYEPCRGHINDIALIELDIEAKPEEASPICMPEEDDSMLYQTVTAIGYGTDSKFQILYLEKKPALISI